ncbi:GNAT family N-acetyltransferase [Adlercreutzia faecimuris]|uniref:GNAT family N-acetyltransferase n=1 Tax=Adlercreutzia faecimuris TaxID=2897341 RepID=A0ABS9WI82_9ACTN|nr:GNAT family N-acetyltransferase [Adlercreutzia sp. JBNU-10]MCI2242162.1 GNAT family N-acetyltransferase [Adlercreutzia sp. JBNU-10]
MEITAVAEREDALVGELLALWRASVEATHDFLTPVEVDRIAGYVPDALRGVEALAVARDDQGGALGFAGVDGDGLEMLFVAPAARGTGVGTALLRHAVGTLGARRLDVNEQNPAARGFYEHRGFRIAGRSPVDGQGDPYPLLHLELADPAALGLPTTIETERLVLRPWREGDADDLFALARDPRVGPPAGWPPHGSVEESREVIRTVFSAPETYAITLRGDGRPVGCVGLLTGDAGTEPLAPGEAEVGYWVGVPWQDHGIATEAARALMRRAFDDLGLSALWCSYRADNGPSARVAAKCGFAPHHVTRGLPRPLMDDACDACFTRLDRTAWQAARDGASR